ncbi:MAG: hypothetical protein PHG73_09665 [Pygmaiobacter sp.]|jgi:hypothetical protein|nr:hypothetical protein [Pygmaiobacter sp.]
MEAVIQEHRSAFTSRAKGITPITPKGKNFLENSASKRANLTTPVQTGKVLTRRSGSAGLLCITGLKKAQAPKAAQALKSNHFILAFAKLYWFVGKSEI